MHACGPGAQWLGKAWSTDPGAVYRWLKDESFAPPVTILTHPDAMAKANLQEMECLLQDTWRPINRKYAAASESVRQRKYGHHVRMLASPLTGDICAADWHKCTRQRWGLMAGAWPSSGPSRMSFSFYHETPPCNPVPTLLHDCPPPTSPPTPCDLHQSCLVHSFYIITQAPRLLHASHKTKHRNNGQPPHFNKSAMKSSNDVIPCCKPEINAKQAFRFLIRSILGPRVQWPRQPLLGDEGLVALCQAGAPAAPALHCLQQLRDPTRPKRKYEPRDLSNVPHSFGTTAPSCTLNSSKFAA